MTDADAALDTLRRRLLALLVAGCAGTAAELLLAKHTDGPWQWTPLVLLILGLLVSAAHVAWRGRPFVFAFRVLMALFVASGAVGTWLHYRAKAGFALERHPDLAGLALFREALTGTNPPLLAPGAMAALGLLGLAWAARRSHSTGETR